MPGLGEHTAAQKSRNRIGGSRRSADRTSLRRISLLTGNFTGNFAESAALSPLPEQIAGRIIEIFGRIP
jgi:hypothetical protein